MNVRPSSAYSQPATAVGMRIQAITAATAVTATAPGQTR